MIVSSRSALIEAKPKESNGLFPKILQVPSYNNRVRPKGKTYQGTQSSRFLKQ